MTSFVKASSRALKKIPIVRRPVLFLQRVIVASSYYKRPLIQMVRWFWRSRENTNFTYDLTEGNKDYMAAFISEITGKTFEEVRGYIRELEQDSWLVAHIKQMAHENAYGHVTDPEIWFCKRLGWYALVRAQKPAVTVETGVDKGLGSCVISRALERNEEEGRPGVYYGTDINPEAGYLFAGRLRKFGKLLIGDSLESLRNLKGQIDIFINDSDHSAEYERAEYEVVFEKLSAGAIILGDNAHVTDELLKFSLKHQRSFLFFQEKPRDHWYPGGGIGASFKKTSCR